MIFLPNLVSTCSFVLRLNDAMGAHRHCCCALQVNNAEYTLCGIRNNYNSRMVNDLVCHWHSNHRVAAACHSRPVPPFIVSLCSSVSPSRSLDAHTIADVEIDSHNGLLLCIRRRHAVIKLTQDADIEKHRRTFKLWMRMGSVTERKLFRLSIEMNFRDEIEN